MQALAALLGVLLTSFAPLPGQPAPAATQAAAPLRIGLNTHDIRPEAVAAMRRLGVSDVRATLYWDVWESDPNYRIWFPALLQEARAAGMRVLVVVHGHDPRGLSDREAALDRFATWVAARIREMPYVESWQLWNEIDGAHFTPLFDGLSMRERGLLYGRHLAAVADRVPQARLVATGIHPQVAPEFWAGVLRYHRPHAFAVHVYGPPLDERVREVAAPLRAAARGVPIWATEFGLEVGLSSEAAQLTAWQAMERASRGVFERLYGYALTTDEHGASGRAESHGILRPDGGERPAATWLRQHHLRLRGH